MNCEKKGSFISIYLYFIAVVIAFRLKNNNLTSTNIIFTLTSKFVF